MKLKLYAFIISVLITTTLSAQDLGNALNFDGVDDYVSIPSGGGLNNQQAGTIEMWVRWTGLQMADGQGGFGPVTARQSDAIFSNQVLALDNTNPATAHVTWRPYGAGGIAITSSSIIGDDVWRHVAVTYSSGSHMLYINGLLVGTSATTGTIANNAAMPLTLGAWVISGIPKAFKGEMDEVRVWNTARTATQIQNIYYKYIGNEAGLVTYYDFNSGIAGGNNAGITTVISLSNSSYNGATSGLALIGNASNWVTSLPNLSTTSDMPIAYFPFNGNTIDESINSNDGTNNGAVLTADRFGKSNSAFLFNGTSNYIDMGNHPSLDISDGFSISAWVNRTGPGVFQTIASRGYSGNGEFTFTLYDNGTNFVMRVWVEGEVYEGTVTVASGWNHLALVAQTGINGIRTYLNGVLSNQWTSTKDLFGKSAYNLRLGNNQLDNSYFFNGYIDDVSIYNKALSNTDIQVLAKGVKSDFYGGQFNNALDFDGVKDYVTIPNSVVSGLTSFTFETWARWDGSSTDDRFFDFGFLNTDYIYLSCSSFGITKFYSGSGAQTINFTPFPTNTWHHIAVTLNAITDTGIIYVDGNEVARNSAFTFTPNDLTSNRELQYSRIGSSNYYVGLFDGALDETRMWNVALSPVQILERMNAPLKGDEPNLVYYYNYDQGTPGGNNTAIETLQGNTAQANGYLTGFDRSGNQSNFIKSGVLRGKLAISEILPTSARPGEVITLFGSGFHPLTGFNKVFFGSQEAVIKKEGNNQIKVIVPEPIPNEGNSISIQVRNSFGVTNPIQFSRLRSGFDQRGIKKGFIFRDEVVSDFSNAVYRIKSADFNGDGFLDVVGGSKKTTDIFLNNMKGNFPNKVSMLNVNTGRASFYEETYVEVADLDGDGDVDILTTIRTSPETDGIGWFRNNGDGTFGSRIIITTTNYEYHGNKLSDIDEDGDIDILALTAAGGTGKVTWFSNNGTGTFSSENILFTKPAVYPNTACFIDFDVDGDRDLIFSYDYNSVSAGEILLMKNLGKGNFGLPILIEKNNVWGNRSIYAADVNKDGRVDIVSGNYLGSLLWHRNELSGAFTSFSILGPNQPTSVFPGDLDGDADIDLVSGNYYSGGISWYSNNGTGTFTKSKITDVAFVEPQEPNTADLDSDGDLDILFPWRYSDRIVAYKNISTDKEIITFEIPDQISSTVNKVDYSIEVTVPNQLSLTRISAKFTLSELAKAVAYSGTQTSEVTLNDFSQPLIYTVMAEDGTKQDWTVTTHPLPSAPTITSITSIQATSATINWSKDSYTESVLFAISVDTFKTFVSGYESLEITGNTKTLIGLTSGTTYQIILLGKNRYGISQNYSGRASLLTLPLAPTIDAVTAITQTSANVSWQTVTGTSIYRVDLLKEETGTVPPYNNYGVAATNLTFNGLSGGTTYLIRLRSSNAGGSSPNFTSKTFTTIPPDPLISAATAITSTSFIANWQSASSATTYTIELTENNFISILKTNTSIATSTSFTSLALGKSYAYRVRATNATGTSGNSAAALVVPSYSVTITSELFDTNTKIASVVATSSAGIDSVKLFYRGIASGNFKSVNVPLKTGTTYTIDIKPDMLDEMGTEYYFEVKDKLKDKRTGAINYYYKRINTSDEIQIPFTRFGRGGENYTLFSVPYVLDDQTIQSVFEPTLGAYKNTKWRLIRYQDLRNVDYGDGLSKLEPGLGYWFTALDKVEIKIGAGTVVAANRTLPFTLNLQRGWNQIGNPLPFDVSWTDVLVQNKEVPGVGKLYIFEAGSFKKGDLKLWGGGFVKSERDVALKIPVTIKRTTAGRVTDSEIDNQDISLPNWIVPLVIQQGEIRNDMGAIGMQISASISNDEFDEQSPPRFINYLELNSYHPEYFLPRFMRDIVPPAMHYNWSYLVESNGEGRAELKWDNLALGINAAQLLLYDEEGRQFVDMKLKGSYVFDFTGKRKLKFFYSIDKELLSPDVDGAGQAFPNPFDSNTTIPFIVGKDDTGVTCTVYDLLGKPIKTILANQFKAGYHETQWDGSDNYGIKAASGLYIYRINFGNSPFQTGKVILK